MFIKCVNIYKLIRKLLKNYISNSSLINYGVIIFDFDFDVWFIFDAFT